MGDMPVLAEHLNLHIRIYDSSVKPCQYSLFGTFRKRALKSALSSLNRVRVGNENIVGVERKPIRLGEDFHIHDKRCRPYVHPISILTTLTDE